MKKHPISNIEEQRSFVKSRIQQALGALDITIEQLQDYIISQYCQGTVRFKQGGTDEV